MHSMLGREGVEGQHSVAVFERLTLGRGSIYGQQPQALVVLFLQGDADPVCTPV
jgi:hypothetical protein